MVELVLSDCLSGKSIITYNSASRSSCTSLTRFTTITLVKRNKCIFISATWGNSALLFLFKLISMG